MRLDRVSLNCVSGIMLAEIFYYPGDWLASNTDARQRRAAGTWAFIVWIFPGLPIWLYWRDALWFVGFMSLFALWWTGWAGIGTETPVEIEDSDVTVNNLEGGDTEIHN